MEVLQITFWILIFIVFYTYVGYGILLYCLIKMKRFFNKESKVTIDSTYEPEVTLFIAAYNEKNYVEAKMKNTLELDYPPKFLKLLQITPNHSKLPQTTPNYSQLLPTSPHYSKLLQTTPNFS